MANQFSARGVIDTASYPDLLNKGIDVIWERRNEFAGNLGQFFETETMDSGLSYVVSTVGSALGLPPENQDTEALPYVTPAPGFDKTFTLTTYRQGIRVTKTMLKADRFNKIMSMITGLVKSGQQLDEYQRAAIISGAFATTTGADGSYLIADSHPQENPEVTAWDNLGTGALTRANLQALRLLARKHINEQGDPDPLTPKTLLIPEDLEETAAILIGSPQEPEGALNNVNVLINKGIDYVVSPYLTSSTAYFLFCDLMGPQRGLHQFVLEPWEIADNSPANADVVVDKRIKATQTFGATSGKNILGSTGA